MQRLIDAVISSNVDDVTEMSQGGIVSTSVFFTASQLARLIQFLKDIQVSGTEKKNDFFD